MAHTDFYNENRRRKYPFVFPASGAFTLLTTPPRQVPDHWILDCGFSYGALADYDISEDDTYLISITKNGGALTFVFNHGFAFSREVTTPEGATGYESSSNDGGSAYGIGFLVTGDLSELSDLQDGTWNVSSLTPMVVEPSLVVSEKSAQVFNVHVANIGRVSFGAPGSTVIVPPTDAAYYVGSVLGNVEVVPGHNAEVYTAPRSNTLVISARKGAGLGPACDPLERYLGDPSVITGDRQLCQNLIYSIGGAGGTYNVSLRGGRGVAITEHPLEHKIRIQINSRETTGCEEQGSC